MVRVAAQERFFLSKKLETGSLSYTHKTDLVKLPNDEAKVKLVKTAMKKALTTRQLEARIGEIKKQRGTEPKSLALLFSKEVDNPKKLFGNEEVLTVLQDRESLQQKLKELKPKKLKALSAEANERAEEAKQWVKYYQDLVEAIEGMTTEG
jgi:ParB-like chromosome segregation protein Spo0J